MTDHLTEAIAHAKERLTRYNSHATGPIPVYQAHLDALVRASDQHHDMLAALQEVERGMGCAVWRDDHLAPSQALYIIRAAIAKATA